MTPNLITLTASSLDGCRGGIRLIYPSHPQRTMTFVGVIGDAIYMEVYDSSTRLSASVSTRDYIQCHPSDYVRAWLGPVGELFKKGRYARRSMGGIRLYENDDSCGEHGAIKYFDCPDAIDSAMGNSVWRRTETGWEVVE